MSNPQLTHQVQDFSSYIKKLEKKIEALKKQIETVEQESAEQETAFQKALSLLPAEVSESLQAHQAQGISFNWNVETSAAKINPNSIAELILKKIKLS
ncbi:MAG: hypothetical protein OHK0017_01900 [Patescibacteria group bacterium]